MRKLLPLYLAAGVARLSSLCGPHHVWFRSVTSYFSDKRDYNVKDTNII